MTTYRFGDCRFDADRNLLRRGDVTLSLAPKTADLLVLFLRRAGQVLKREEIFSALWPDAAVSDAALWFQIAQLREALGPHAQWLRTVARRGYLWAAADVEAAAPTGRPAAGPLAGSDGHSPEVLVGRSEERASLAERLRLAAAGTAQLVVLSGAMGVGKTRLLTEVETSARALGARVLRSRFLAPRHGLPLFGFYEFFAEVLTATDDEDRGADALDDHWPELMGVFPQLGALREIRTRLRRKRLSSGPAEQVRRDPRSVLAGALNQLAEERPLVLLIEDLQASDESLDALHTVFRQLSRSRTLVVATLRTDLVETGHPALRFLDDFRTERRFLLVELGPLSENEHTTLLAASKLVESAADRARIFALTGGNPLLSIELARALGETPTPALDRVPRSLEQAVERRLYTLPDNQRDALQRLSILGPEFPAAHAQRLLGARFAEVEALESRGLLLAQGRGVLRSFRFVPPLLTSHLYRVLGGPQRRALHQSFVLDLERRSTAGMPEELGALLQHSAAAEDAERTIRYGMLLAERSLERTAVDEAERAARTVLDFVESSREQGDPPAPVVAARARLVLARAHRHRREVDAAIREITLAVEGLDRCGFDLEASSAATLAVEVAWEGRRVEEAERFLQVALRRARQLRDRRNLPNLLGHAALLAALRGDLPSAESAWKERDSILPGATPPGSPRAGTLSVAVPAPLRALWPHDIELAEEVEALGQVFQTLVGVGESGAFEARLAVRWDASDNHILFTFEIDPGATWSTGEPVLALEVKQSLERAMLAISRRRLAYTLQCLIGATAFVDGRAPECAGIEVTSPRALTFRCEGPTPLLPAYLTDPIWAIARPGTPHGPNLEDLPVGSGPFVLAARSPGILRLERRLAGGPGAALEGIAFHHDRRSPAIAAGLADGSFDVGSGLSPLDLEGILRRRRPPLSLSSASRWASTLLLVVRPERGGRLADLATRRALWFATDPSLAPPSALGRTTRRADTLLPPDFPGHDPAHRKPSHGASRIHDAQEMSIRVAVHPAFLERWPEWTAAIFESWRQSGLEPCVVARDTETFLATTRAPECDYDVVLARWVADFFDPDAFIGGLFHSERGRFRSASSSADLDRAIDRARGLLAPAARRKAYRDIEQQLVDQALMRPLFHELDLRLATTRVHGLAPTGAPPFVDYSKVSLVEPRNPVERPSLVVPIAAPSVDLDPATVFTLEQGEVVPQLFESLVRAEEGAQIVPWLAEEFRAEEGATRYYVRLRPDVRFHDGRAVTARDVRYSWERLLSHPESRTRWLLEPIRGAAEILGGRASELGGFTILSTREFTIDLVRPLPFFPALAAYSPAAILPEGLDRFDGGWREGVVGTGPFRLVRAPTASELSLEANPHYWRRGLPRSERLTFAFGITADESREGLLVGRYSVATALKPPDVATVRSAPEFAGSYRERPGLTTYYVAFNARRGPLRARENRQRLAAMIASRPLAERHLSRLALPAGSLIPPGLLRQVPRRRPPSSRQEPTGERIALRALVNPGFEAAHAELVADLFLGCAEQGFAVSPIEGPPADYHRALRDAEADLVVTRWIADYPDADNFAFGLLHSREGILGRFCGSPELDQWVVAGRTEEDWEARQEIYRSIEEHLADQHLVAPLFHPLNYCLVTPALLPADLRYFAPFVAYESLDFRD